MVLRLYLPPFPCNSRVFGTVRSRPGRAIWARRRKIFSGVEKILLRAPWTARNVLKDGGEGKGGGGFRGFPPGGGPGRRPAHLTARAVWRAVSTLRRPLRPASLPAQNREASLNPRGLLNVYRKRGGIGDSLLQARSSLLLAAAMRSAHSVSLMPLACLVQLGESQFGFLGTAPPAQRFEFFVRRGIILQPVAPLALATRIQAHRRKSTGPMKVQVRVQVRGIELLHRFGVLGRRCGRSRCACG